MKPNNHLLLCILLTTLFSNPQIDEESNFYTAISNSNHDKNIVTDYSVDNDFDTDDSVAWQTAIDDISDNGGGVLTIPAGNYTIRNIDLKSNVHIEIDPDAIIRPFQVDDGKNYSIFKLADGKERIYNVSIICSDLTGLEEGHICDASEAGRYTVDLTQVVNNNVTVFAIRNAENFLVADFHVNDVYTDFSAVTLGTTKVGGYSDGTIKNTLTGTDTEILAAFDLALAMDSDYSINVTTVHNTHIASIESLIPVNDQQNAKDMLAPIIQDLSDELDEIAGTASLPGNDTKEELIGYYVDRLENYMITMVNRSEVSTNYFMPLNGIVRSGSVCNAAYGYGTIQSQAATNVLFKDLYGFGGATLRLETGYSKMNNVQYGGNFDIVARNIYSEQGNSTLMISPHAMHCGAVDAEGIRSKGSGFDARIEGGFISKKYCQDVGLEIGTYSYVKVVDVDAEFGMVAQLKSKHFYLMPDELVDDITDISQDGGESVIGPSIATAVNDANYICSDSGEQNVFLEDVSQVGFEFQEPVVPEEHVPIVCDNLSVGEIDTNVKSFIAYPNPNKGLLTVKSEENGILRIMNLLGTVLREESIEDIHEPKILDISYLPSGMYIVVFEGETTRETQYLFVN